MTQSAFLKITETSLEMTVLRVNLMELIMKPVCVSLLRKIYYTNSDHPKLQILFVEVDY